MTEKKFFSGLDLLQPNVIEPTKMPRTAAIPVVCDPKTGYLNAGTYSCGVANLNPLHILFGPKGADAIEAFQQVDEFTLAVPARDQIFPTWITALEIPHGISEIDVAGWHTLPAQVIGMPGIKECPLNLECKKIFTGKLPPPWRTIVIGEVVGVHIDRSLLELSRSDVVRYYPMHEAGSHPDTGLYSPSVLSGPLLPPAQAGQPWNGPNPGEDKVFISQADLFRPENDRVLMNAVFPRPAYILMTVDEHNHPHATPLMGGSLQSTEPAVQITLQKDTNAYQHIKKSGEFVISVPDFTTLKNYEVLESCAPDFGAAGFSLLPANAIKTQGLAECLVSMDCKVVYFEDVPGTNYAFIVGRRVGVALDPETHTRLDPQLFSLHDRLQYINEFYGSFLYSVLDRGMERKWGFHDPQTISVPALPSWGSRYTGGWWGPGPALNFWLIELCQEGLLDKEEYYKIMFDLRMWNNGRLIPHLAEYIDAQMKAELRRRLTTLFKKMACAHRDLSKWEEVHEYLRLVPTPPRDHHSGPVYHEKWYDPKI